MGEPQTPHFYDFGILGRVPEPQNQLFLSLETPGHLKQIKKIPLNNLKTYYCYKTQNSGNRTFWEFPKGQAPNNPDVPFDQFLKIMDMRPISSKKHEMEIW